MKIVSVAALVLSFAALAGCGNGDAAVQSAAAGAVPGAVSPAVPEPVTSGVVTVDDASFMYAAGGSVSFLRWTESEGYLTGTLHYVAPAANYDTGTDAVTKELTGVRTGDSVRLTVNNGTVLTGVISGRGGEASLTIADTQDDGRITNIVFSNASVDEYNAAVAAVSGRGKGAAQAQDDATAQYLLDQAVEESYEAFNLAVVLVEDEAQVLGDVDLKYRKALADVAGALQDTRTEYAKAEDLATASRPDCSELQSQANYVRSQANYVQSSANYLESKIRYVLGLRDNVASSLASAREALADLESALAANPVSDRAAPHGAALEDATRHAEDVIVEAQSGSKDAQKQADASVDAAFVLSEDAENLSGACWR